MVYFHARHRPQFFLQRVDVGPESAEVFRYGERQIRNNIKSDWLSVRVLKREHLRQRHFLLEAIVAEPAQDDRVSIEVPQCHGFGYESGFAAFRLIVAENVLLEVAFPSIRASR